MIATAKTWARANAARLAGLSLVIAGTVALLLTSAAPVPDYPLAEVRKGRAAVPRAFIPRLPTPALRAAPPEQRKDLFLRAVLPLVLRANEAVAKERARLLGILRLGRGGQKPPRRDRKWLAKLAARYGVSADEPAALASRVDIVPPSLVLAQAAIESGWGTSRFAADGNALFGIRGWKLRWGLKPKDRPKTESHRVRAYADLYHSVRAYLRNLNTHPAHGALRRIRAALRRARGRLDGRRLAEGLGGYSELGGAYVRLVAGVMKSERLWEFDRARLER